MKKAIRLVAASAVTLVIATVAVAQSSSTNSSAKQNEKDYRSLQYGNGQITKQQNEAIQRRAQQLNEAMQDDGTSTPTPTPTASPRRGTARPQ